MSLHDCPNCECEEDKEDSSFRVLRGGSWYAYARGARSASRSHVLPWARYYDVGFRLVRFALGTLTPLRYMNFISMPSGKFTIGSPKSESGRYSYEKQREVIIESPFEIMDAPVTQNQWIQVMGNNPSHFKGNGENPVEKVSFFDVFKFIEELDKGYPNQGFRLPTEEEWEYACRAGTTTAYSFGDDPKDLKDYAWYYENSKVTTHPVKQKKPNAWGLYDMHGNVWEWTSSKC